MTTTTLTEIQIPSDVETAIKAIHGEKKKLSAISTKAVLELVNGYSKTDIQIYITLYKANYKPVNPFEQKLDKIAHTIDGYTELEGNDLMVVLDDVSSILSE